MLAYFDVVLFHVMDAVHNLLLGIVHQGINVQKLMMFSGANGIYVYTREILAYSPRKTYT